MSVPAAATATAGSARLGVLQDKSNLPAAATLHRVHSDAKRNTENALGARKALAPSPQARPAAQGALRVFRDLQADSKSRLGTDGGGEEPQLRAASAPAATATESLNTGSAARTSWWLRKRATSVDAGVPASRAPPAFVPYRDPAVSPLHARHSSPAAAARQDQPAAARLPFQQVVHPKRGSFPAAPPPPPVRLLNGTRALTLPHTPLCTPVIPHVSRSLNHNPTPLGKRNKKKKKKEK
ncbi:hypothetical protein HDU82_006270 [Entophlyctis luteolus]|nr:hypothetical protein HDU82_006270 [Entophlyctis luteolus]